MTQEQPAHLGDTELWVPGQQPIRLGTPEAGHPVIGDPAGPRVQLHLHTMDGRVVRLIVRDLAWVGELENQLRVLRGRARGVIGGGSE